MISCPSCGTLNVDGTSQCMRCGAVFPSKVAPVGPATGDVPSGAQTPGPAAAPPASNAGFGDLPASGGGFGAPPVGGGFGQPPAGGGFGQPPAGGGGGGFGAPPANNAGAVPGDYRVAPVGITQTHAGQGTAPAAAPATLDVGDVVGTAFEVWKATFVPLTTLWAVCLAPGWFVGTIGAVYQAYAIGAASGGVPSVGGPVAAAGLTMLGSLIQFAGFALAAAPATKMGLDAIARRPLESLQQSLAYGLENAFTMAGISFLTSLAFGIGLVLCCVPAAFVWCIAVLAIPAAIAESRGVTDAFQRSSDLTDGTRTEVFLVGLCVVALYIAVSIPVFCVAGGVAAGGVAAGGGAGAAGGTFVQQILVFITTLLTYNFSALVAVVMYVRRTGFGARTDAATVANVFG